MAKKAKKRTKFPKKKVAKYWLTASDLREKDTCGDYLDRFIRAFGEGGGPINLENLIRAHRLGFPLAWLADNFCDDPSNWDASDYFINEALDEARQKYPIEREAAAHAMLDTFKKYPPTGLLTPAAAKKQNDAIKAAKAIIEKHGLNVKQLGLDPEGHY